MEYFIMYIVSILMSFGMDLDTSFQVIKDIADAGGKFNIDKLVELEEILPQYNKTVTRVARFIPIVNVCYSLFTRATYEGRKYDVLRQLELFGAIEEMTEEEKEEYNKKPTRLNALSVTSKKTVKTEKVVFAKKLDKEPVEEEDYPLNRMVLTFGDSSYAIEGDTLDEQFDNVFMFLNTYEKILDSDNEEVRNLSSEERKQLLVELKTAKVKLLKMQKQIKKDEKKLLKQKK